MEELIKMFLIATLFSIFLIPLTNAGTQDIWEQCGDSNDQPTDTGHTKEIDNKIYYYCCKVGANYQWQINDCASPSCSVSSITESSDYAYASGTTVHYSTASTGSFTVDVSSTDTESGVKKVDFPTTVSGGGDDTTPPYTWAYTWDASDTFKSSATATCYDKTDNINTASFTVNKDVTLPSGGSITYTDGTYTAPSVPITLSKGTDTESGIATDYIERQESPLSGTCGTFGSWSTVKTNPGTSWTDTTVNDLTCYKYQYIVKDNVNNKQTYTSTSMAKINIPAPTVTINSPAAGTYQPPTGSADQTKFDVSVTFSDTNGLAECSYQVHSNGVQTFPASGSQTIACSGTSVSKTITLTVGSDSNCRDEGVDKCEIRVGAKNFKSATSSRSFSTDFNPPVVGQPSPASACKDESQTFEASVSDKGSGISECRLMVDGSDVTNQVGLMTVTEKNDDQIGDNDSICEASESCETSKSYTFTNSRGYLAHARCKDNIASHTATDGADVTVNVDKVKTFSLSLDSTVSVWRLDTASNFVIDTIDVSSQCGFSDSVTLSKVWIGQEPSGVTAKLTDTSGNEITSTPSSGNFRVRFDVSSSAALGSYALRVSGSGGSPQKTDYTDITLNVYQPSISVSATSPVKADGTTTSEVTASAGTSGVTISLTTDRGTFQNGQAAVTCTTGSNGACPIQELKSNTPGIASVTAGATDYQAGAATVEFSNVPKCSLTVNPASGVGPLSSSISVSYSQLDSAPGTISIKCGDGNTVTATGCNNKDGSCSATCDYGEVTNDATYTIDTLQQMIGGADCSSVSITVNPPPCTPSIQILESQMPYFGTDDNLQPKQGLYAGEKYTWTLKVKDMSTGTGCSASSLNIPAVTESGSCTKRSGVYLTEDNLKKGKEVVPEDSFQLQLNAVREYKVSVESVDKTNACTLSFNFAVSGKTIDPSFTVNPGGADPQAPQVSFFSFTGDKSNFDVEWEAFYPNLPTRTMEVECGLNCDPDVQDCSAVAGKGCLPYPYQHGSEEMKKGRCRVNSPAYNLVTNGETMKCNFYDPNSPALKTPVTRTFTAIDFEIRGSNSISTTVGQPAELKVDVANMGILTDDYTITLSAETPEAIDISPATVTTGSIALNQITSSFFSVTPIVDTGNKITVTVESNTKPTIVKTLEIGISPGLFALPEFGLIGFLQIVATAAVIYFLLFNRMASSHRRKRK